MAKVFISHSVHDRHFVETGLVPALVHAGHGYWYSRESIMTAELWERSILRGLESCDWFAVVLSVRSAASEYVKDEINWAIEHRHGRVIPVMQSDCKLTDFHIRLPRIQYVDWRSDAKAARIAFIALLDRSNSPVDGAVATKAPYTSADQDWRESRSSDSKRSIAASTRLIESRILAPDKLALAYNTRGCALVRANRFDDALMDFSSAITLEPKNAIFYANRGGLYWEKRGDVDNAMRDLAQAVALEPDDPDLSECYNMLGKIHLGEKRYWQAISFFDRAIDLPHIVTGTQPGAIASVESHLDLAAYFYRGEAYEKLHHRKEAIENYQLAAAWPVYDDELLRLQAEAKARLVKLGHKA